MRSQGFGKRSSAVGMPRPKKAKLQLVAESGLSESTGITGTMQSEESEASAHNEQEELTAEEDEKYSDKEARQQRARQDGPR